MNLSWTGIVNTASRIATVTKVEINKIVGVAGKDINAAIKIFIKCEPVAVTALTPFCPEAAPILNTFYVIAQKIEANVNVSGASKLAMATGIFTDAVIPTVEAGLNAAGKTIDTAKIAELAPDLFSAVVAENNAQAEVAAILQAAATTKTLPDVAALAKAEADVAAAVATVKKLGLAIQAAVSSIAPATV